MQNTKHGVLSKARIVPFLAALTGVLGFMFSLALALQVLRTQGNPGFLIIWLFAVAATAASMRFDRKWRETFERICSMKTTPPMYAMHKTWSTDVEDVVFREIPCAPGSSAQ